jgi:hypothetical protein
VLLLAGGDFVLTKFIYGYPYTIDHLITVAWYAAVLLMGRLILENARPVRVVVAALATSVGFFAISNFGVWLTGNMYPLTLNGLAACYAAAVPFFRKQVVSDVLFTVVMFSVPALIALMKPQPAKA